MKYLALLSLVFSFSVNAQQFKVLLITETAGWHHESIDNGIIAINKLAEKHNFIVERQQEFRKITDNSLKDFDAIIFLSTSGDIFNEEEQKAFENFIQSGKGYVGIHAASDTEYEWNWYRKLVGRMFYLHPAQQTARINTINHDFPGLEHFPDTLLFTDEWYEFDKEEVNNLNYLITLDESSYNPKATWGKRDTNDNMVDVNSNGMGDFHPISWYHEFDGGRSFYTALGHIPAIYSDSWFLEHLYGGIYYAATGKGIHKKN